MGSGNSVGSDDSVASVESGAALAVSDGVVDAGAEDCGAGSGAGWGSGVGWGSGSGSGSAGGVADKLANPIMSSGVSVSSKTTGSSGKGMTSTAVWTAAEITNMGWYRSRQIRGRVCGVMV